MLSELIAEFLELYYLPGEIILATAAAVAPELVARYIGSTDAIHGSRLAAQLSGLFWVATGIMLIAWYRWCRALYWTLSAHLKIFLAPIRRFMRILRVKLACLFSAKNSLSSTGDTIQMEVVEIDDLSFRLLRIAYQCDGVTPCTREKLKDSLTVSDRELDRTIKRLTDLQLLEAGTGGGRPKSEYCLTANGKFYFHACDSGGTANFRAANKTVSPA
jgi:hypothetical protein